MFVISRRAKNNPCMKERSMIVLESRYPLVLGMGYSVKVVSGTRPLTLG